MNIHIINTGRELMLGWRLNTHHQWLCHQLAQRGYLVGRQIAVDDSGPAVQQAVRDALQSADLVLTTGGLGPTSDDRTRELVAELLGKPLHRDPAVLAHIESFFTARKRPCPERVHVQADVPEGAEVIQNAFGTAPGLAMEITATGGPARWLIMLPGPPRELKPMFQDQVLPMIRSRFPLPQAVASRVLRSTGLGESLVEEKLSPSLKPLESSGLEVGYCARPGEVDIQLVAHGDNPEAVVAEAEKIVRTHVGQQVFGQGEEQLEEIIIRELTARRQTVAVAESCTGGYIANRLTNVPGASEAFLGGVVSYSNEAKMKFLGVNPSTLKEHGAVSRETACEMAAGIRAATGADFGIASTGIAGPSGGTPDKPVGTVCIALSTPDHTKAHTFQNPYDRLTFKYVTSQQALDWLRQVMTT